MIDGNAVVVDKEFYDHGGATYMDSAKQLMFYAAANESLIYVNDVRCSVKP